MFTASDYAELLGLYLGDGYIVRTGRSDRFRLFLDTAYGRIIDDAHALLARCFPGHRVGRFRTGKGTTTILSLYSTHLTCLFPQHGVGMKHERDIVLEAWQTMIVEREPWSFLRGLIRSDGCVFVNRTGRLRVPLLRVQQQVGADPRALHGRVRPSRRRVSALPEIRADLPPCERCADGGARRFEGLIKR